MKIIYLLGIIIINLSISYFAQIFYYKYKQSLKEICKASPNYALKLLLFTLLITLCILSSPTRAFSEIYLSGFDGIFGRK